jgi:hypothetical protein
VRGTVVGREGVWEVHLSVEKGCGSYCFRSRRGVGGTVATSCQNYITIRFK